MSKTQSASPKPSPLPSLAIQRSWTALCPLPHCEFFSFYVWGCTCSYQKSYSMSLLPYSLKASLASQLTLKIPSLLFESEITRGPSHLAFCVGFWDWAISISAVLPFRNPPPARPSGCQLTCFPPSSSCASQTFPDSFLLKCTNRYFSGIKHCCFHLGA